MTGFTTRELAQIAVDAKNRKEPTQFCPLINGACRKDCICWVSYIQSNASGVSYNIKSVDTWYARDGYCNNAMFNETVYLQQ